MHVIEKVHELIASGVRRHLLRIERDLRMPAVFEAPTFIFFPLRRISSLVDTLERIG